MISGLMAQYQNTEAKPAGVDNLPAVLRAVMFQGVRIEAFTQAGQDAHRPEFEAEMARLIASGQIKSDLHIVDGIENLPQAQVNLFEKSDTGKVVVRVGAPSASAAR